jgi:replicative DNA helicase
MSFKRTKISSEIENNIITSMIVSDEFCKRILPIVKPEHFASPFAKTVFKWVRDFYQEFGKAPDKKIQDLFHIHQHKINDEEISLISAFLEKLNETYLSDEESYNVLLNDDFYYKRAIDYVDKQSLLSLARDVKAYAELEQLEDAKEAISNYKKVMKTSSGMFNPNDPEEVAKHFNSNEHDKIFKMPGVIGDLFGWWMRGYFVFGQGVYGSGKTSFLQEIRIKAMRDRLKVVDFNLEMSKRQFNNRYYKRLTNLGEVAGQFLYPEFDCLLNQVGVCKKLARTCQSKIRNDFSDAKPLFEDAPLDYKPCTACRGTKEFVVETWFTSVIKEAMDEWGANYKIKAAQRNWGDCSRAKCYPRGRANSSDFEHDLDVLEYTENFIPDIMIVDYAQLMREEDGLRHGTEEEKINESFIALAAMAKERNIIVITVGQVTTQVLESKSRGKHGRMGDAAGSRRAAYAHPDFVFSLMQTDEEKDSGVVRFNVVKARDHTCNESREVLVLQQLDVSNALLDSERKIERF